MPSVSTTNSTTARLHERALDGFQLGAGAVPSKVASRSTSQLRYTGALTVHLRSSFWGSQVSRRVAVGCALPDLAMATIIRTNVKPCRRMVTPRDRPLPTVCATHSCLATPVGADG